MIGMASMEYESTDDLKKELETKNKEIKSLRELVSRKSRTCQGVLFHQ